MSDETIRLIIFGLQSVIALIVTGIITAQNSTVGLPLLMGVLGTIFGGIAITSPLSKRGE